MRYPMATGGGVVVVLCLLGGSAASPVAEAAGVLSPDAMAGQVVDPSGQAASGAMVWLVGGLYDEDARSLGKTTTDGQGRFTFPDAKAKYVGGKTRLPHLVARDAQGRFGGETHPWQYPGPTTQQNVLIKLAAVQDHHGRLLDAAGQPISQASIRLSSISPIGIHEEGYANIELPAELSTEFACRTSADGSFTLRNVPVVGSVAAKITASGFGSPNVAWDLAQPVTLRLGRVGSIRGTLFAPPGANAMHTIDLNLYSGADPAEAKDAAYRIYYHTIGHAGKDGKFRFNDVPPRAYTLDPNLYESNAPYYAKKTASFSVKTGEVTNVELHLLPAVAVRGQVVDKEIRRGIEGAAVAASTISDKGYMVSSRSTTSNAAGRFVVYVEPGKIAVSVGLPPKGYVVPRSKSQRPGIVANGDLTWPTIELQRAVRLEGIVVDDSGRPVPGAEVQSLLPTPMMDMVYQTAGPDGKFKISNLDPKETLALRARTATAVSDVGQLRPTDAKGPLRLVISAARAFSIRGICLDAAGGPVPRAKVLANTSWMLGPTGIGCSMGSCETDAAGHFEMHNLWPGSQYHLSVQAEGFAAFESTAFGSQPGENHDAGRLVLVSTGGFVEGMVLDGSGRPIAGARVFNSGDAPKLLSTKSDAAGQYRLEGFRIGPVYVFAEKDGYRFTHVRTIAKTKRVKISLLRNNAPISPWKPQHAPMPFAQQQKIVRGLLDKLWPLTANSHKRWPIEAMARIDAEKALKWSAQMGGKYDGSVRRMVAERGAEIDAEEVIAMLAGGADRENYSTFMSLASRYASSDREKSLRFAEEAILRGRKFDQPERSWAMAGAGALLTRLGSIEPGRMLIEEAARAAGKLATDGRQTYYRGLVAAALAPHDLPRAMGLVEPVTEGYERQRALAAIAKAIALRDLDKALAIIARLETNSTLPDNARLQIAYELAPTRADDALRVVELMNSHGATKTKAEAYGWVAVAVAPRDRRLARSLIDKGIAAFEDPKAEQEFRSWSNYGGRPVFAAHLVVQAQQVGYPDMAGLISRVLAMRPSDKDVWHAREIQETTIRMAKILALVDPWLAKELLESVVAKGKSAQGINAVMADSNLLQAWAMADIDYAADVIESWARPSRSESFWTNYLIQTFELLTTPPAERAEPLLRYQGGFWFPGEDS
jgi:protocatechuate 3,4-dioxygenase beta subunit